MAIHLAALRKLAEEAAGDGLLDPQVAAQRLPVPRTALAGKKPKR